MATIAITKENFDKEVLQAKTPVLVDFWAPWCGPCKMIAPILEAVAVKARQTKVGKINIDEQPELAEQFAVTSIPTLVLFKNGKEVQRVVGLREEAELMAMLQE